MDNGLMGGISNFGDSFLNSYRAERGYQDAKKQQAVANAQKQREDDIAAAQVGAQAVDVSVPYYNTIASRLFGLQGSPTSAQSPQGAAAQSDTSQDQAQPSQDTSAPQQGDQSGLLSQSPSGLLQYNSKNFGLIGSQDPSAAPTTQTTDPTQSPPSANGSMQLPANTPNKMQRMYQQGLQKEAYDKALAINSQSGENGYTATIDPNDPTKVITAYDQSKLSPSALAKLQQEQLGVGLKKQETVNAAFNGRSPYGGVSSRYSLDPAVVAATTAQPFMAQAIKSYQQGAAGNPKADRTFLASVQKAQGLAPQSPEDIIKDASASQSFKDAANEIINGNLTSASRDAVMQDGIDSFQAKVDSLNAVKPQYIGQAQESGTNPKNIVQSPAVVSTLNTLNKMSKNLIQPTIESNAPGLMGWAKNKAAGFLGIGNSGTTVAAPQHPQDQAAISWARSNPKDPRAAQILQANGVK